MRLAAVLKLTIECWDSEKLYLFPKLLLNLCHTQYYQISLVQTLKSPMWICSTYKGYNNVNT